jgi:hypothetical protein
MRRHGKAKHGLTAPECKRDQSKYACFLQSWTTQSQKYWVVNREDDRKQEAPLEILHPVTEQEKKLRLEAEEEARLPEEQTTSLDRELEHDENTEWLRGCEWPKRFLHKPLHIIVAAAALFLHCTITVPISLAGSLRAKWIQPMRDPSYRST